MDIIPHLLDEFVINNNIASLLKNLDINNVTNIIFYGKNNSGKKTLVDGLLNHLFDTQIYAQKTMCSAELRIGNNKVDIDYISTQYHLEINLYEYGLYDKDIITDFVYDRIKHKSLSKFPYKIFIINHADRLSIQAQLVLRQVVDKCYKTARFIFICEDLCKINDALRSRCYIMRVPLHTKDELKKYIGHISKKYHKFTSVQQTRILNTCNNDLYLLNQIINATIANSKFSYTKFENINRDILKIFKLIEVPNLSSIMEIRSICYNLLLLNFSMKDLFNKIVIHFIPKIKNENKPKFVSDIADMNNNMNHIEHDIICVEYLILKVKKILLLNK